MASDYQASRERSAEVIAGSGEGYPLASGPPAAGARGVTQPQ